MPPPWATVGVFAFGVILAIGGYVYKQYRERHSYENHHRRGRPSPERSQRGRNLTCPICGQRIQRNPHELSCGHQFHRNCYADRLLDSRNEEGIHHLPCPICGETDNRIAGSDEQSRNGTRQRNTGGKCSYCSRALRPNEGERIQLDCGHFAHSVCRDHCGELQQCSNCSVNRTESSKCSLCEMPIQSSDQNLGKLKCGHVIHQSCISIAKFTVCTNCPQMEGAPLD